MVSNVPNSFSSKTEYVFCCCVLVLIKIPVRILVILVVTVPVCIIAFASLVVLQPFLIISAGQRHQVFTYVALRVTQCRTVLYILTGVVGGEVEVNRTCRSGNTQVEVVTAHVSVRQNVLVAHVCYAETNTRLTRVNRQNSGVLGGKTRAEETAGVVWIHQERTLYTVKVLYEEIVGFGSPTAVGS